MSDWNSIVSTALVGSGRTMPPKPDGPVGEALAAYVAEDAESSLLAAAGTLDLWRRAGHIPTETALAGGAAEPERLPEVNSQASTYFATALASRDESLIVEWMELCERAGKIAAPQLLPALLDFSVRNRAHASLASRVGGNRMSWLVAKNPAWLGASVTPEWEAWETAAKKDRVALFCGLRAADAARARDALAAAWPAEPANIRAELLAQLRVGLTMADEPFLESALDDRSKEVRAAAVEILARIPESRLVARMAAHADRLIVLEKSGVLRRSKLTVNPPDTLTPEIIRDGADFKVNMGQIKLGEKALALLHFVAAISPGRWAQQLDIQPSAIVELLEKTEWADAVIAGLAWATARFGGAEWAEALFAHGIHSRPLPFPLRELAAALPEARRASVVEAILRSRNGRPGEVVVELADLLDCFTRFWTESLANAVLELLRKAASGAYEYRLALSMRACLERIPLPLADAATLGWPEDGEWRNTLSPLLERLHIRAAMREAISR